MKPYRLPLRLSGLRHAPEEGQWSLHDTRHVLAPGRVAEEEACRRIDDVLARGLVETGDRGLFLIEALGFEPGRDFLFDAGTVGPAEPRLVAIGANGGIDGRIDAVGAGMPGVEHFPAALVVRRLLRAARADRSPVGRDEVDVHADAFQQI